MSHVTSRALARLAAQVRARQLAKEQQVAARYGWQLREVAPGTYRFRDPRFDQLSSRSPARAGGGRDG